MNIDIPVGDLVAFLQSEGTCIFLDTWTPSHCDLEILPHVVLTSPYTWVPHNVKFPEFADSMQEEVEMRSVAGIASLQSNLTFDLLDRNYCRQLHGFCKIEGLSEDTPDEDDGLINAGKIPHKIIESVRVTENKI